MTRLVLTAALVFAASCRDTTGPLDQLAAARERWSKRGFADYSYTFQAICFCANGNPIRVSVVRDTVRSAIDLTTSQPVSLQFLYTYTVDGLFAVIENGISNHKTVDATYEPTLGYPVHIDYDRDNPAPDAGAIYKVNDLRSGAP